MTRFDQNDEYVWHFKLSEVSPSGDEDALAEMVRQQVEALLCCLIFTSRGGDVTVTGFRFLNDPSREYVLRSPLDELDSETPEVRDS
jgi:hypothetical protein